MFEEERDETGRDVRECVRRWKVEERERGRERERKSRERSKKKGRSKVR